MTVSVDSSDSVHICCFHSVHDARMNWLMILTFNAEWTRPNSNSPKLPKPTFYDILEGGKHIEVFLETSTALTRALGMPQ